jgi:hypothetical protein
VDRALSQTPLIERQFKSTEEALAYALQLLTARPQARSVEVWAPEGVIRVERPLPAERTTHQ